MNVGEVSAWAAENLKDQGVVIARDYKFMCSSLGQELIQKDIKEQGLTRVVVAACSPHLHEKTFRNACKGGGLNPYLCELVSIREQDSWVHTDKVAATEKAKAIISGGVARVIHHEPLEPLRVPIHPATLVVGGGIAGIQAALEIADAGFHVYLVEREPSIGGHMAQFDKTFPTLDCSACILTPKMVDAGNHPNITLLTYSEVEKVDGYVGSFAVTIRKRARGIKEADCTGCGICWEKCPKKVVDDVFEAGMGNRKAVYVPFPQAVPKYPVIDRVNCTYYIKGTCKACEKFCPTNAIDFAQEDEIMTVEVGNVILATGWDPFDARRITQYGYGRLANVFTSLEFERMSNSAGPTGGNIVLRDGKTTPKVVGIVHCVGSRDKNYNEYCSAICCMQSLKFAHLVKEKTGAEVYNFYIDIRTPAKGYEEFYHRLLEEGTHFIRGKVAEISDAVTPARRRRQTDHPGRGYADRESTARPGGYGHPFRRPGTPPRLEGGGETVRHLLQRRWLVDRAASQTGPDCDHDRRHLHRRLRSGSQGYPRQRGAGCSRRRPYPGQDPAEGNCPRTGARHHPRGTMLRLPHLQ